MDGGAKPAFDSSSLSERFLEIRHPAWGDSRLVTGAFRRSWQRCPLRAPPSRPHCRAVSEQAQVGCPLDGLRARHYLELPVDRPEVGFHRVAGNVKSGGDL